MEIVSGLINFLEKLSKPKQKENSQPVAPEVASPTTFEEKTMPEVPNGFCFTDPTQARKYADEYGSAQFRDPEGNAFWFYKDPETKEKGVIPVHQLRHINTSQLIDHKKQPF